VTDQVVPVEELTLPGAPEGLGGIETKAEAEAGAEAEDATPEAAA
jgi:hypothetical protein